MLKAVFTDKSESVISEVSADGKSGKLNDSYYNYDVIEVSNNKWNVINKNGESFSVVLVSADLNAKTYKLKIDGDEIEVGLQTEFDLLLKELGISAQGSKKLKEIKAPMPGLVLDVQVKEGDEVKEGDVVVILEAMKMENVIKASADAKVKKVLAQKGSTIDKGSIMVSFE